LKDKKDTDISNPEINKEVGEKRTIEEAEIVVDGNEQEPPHKKLKIEQ